jgi:hypothetical protein
MIESLSGEGVGRTTFHAFIAVVAHVIHWRSRFQGSVREHRTPPHAGTMFRCNEQGTLANPAQPGQMSCQFVGKHADESGSIDCLGCRDDERSKTGFIQGLSQHQGYRVQARIHNSIHVMPVSVQGSDILMMDQRVYDAIRENEAMRNSSGELSQKFSALLGNTVSGWRKVGYTEVSCPHVLSQRFQLA